MGRSQKRAILAVLILTIFTASPLQSREKKSEVAVAAEPPGTSCHQILERFERANTHNILNDYIQRWKATCLLEDGKASEALSLLTPQFTTERQIEKDIFWTYIQALRTLRRYSDAQTALAQWTRTQRLHPEELTHVLFEKGLIEFEQKKTEAALAFWKPLLINNAGSAFDDDILDLLEKKAVPSGRIMRFDEWRKRAQKLLDVGLPLEANKIYKQFPASGLGQKVELAAMEFKARNYAVAANLYEALWKACGGKSIEILAKLATSYARSDQFEKAIAANEKLIRLSPKSALAKKASEKIAFLYFDSSQYQKAQEIYLSRFKANPKSKEDLERHFWATYLLKDYNLALEDLNLLASRTRSEPEKRRLQYWKSRCLDRLGQKKEALAILRAITHQGSTDYYTLLSIQRIKSGGLKPDTLVDVNNLDIIPDNVRLPEEFKSAHLNYTNHLPALLAQLGFYDYAYDEASHEVGPTHAPAMYWAETNFTGVLRIGVSALKRAPDWDTAPKYFAYAYPMAYGPLVIAQAHTQAISPHLVWSIMRQESTFKATVVSKARAIGLMQVIPSTGHEIAGDLNISHFHHEDLKNPIVSIRFGASYLKKLNDTFGGRIVPTIAAYNAGPEATTRWLKWGNSLELDEFIELIPYDETNEYVRKVLTNYWVYNRLYGVL